jgi:2-amino-4-hydroxy-6-hydroxymethyldihydropteridine diphosphokinase
VNVAAGTSRERAVVALGGNVGDRLGFLRFARRRAAAFAETNLLAASHVYETAPVGGPPQGRYLNAALLIETALAPHALLDALAAVEAEAGRARDVVDGPRTLDLDLLLYGERRIDDARLIVPHPRFAVRAFALLPAADVAPAAVVPSADGRTVAELLARLPVSADAVRVASPESWS